MDTPTTQYTVREGVHIGYQVWGLEASPDTVDVLEFNNGLMISIDETVDEPNWLRYTERVAAFSRLIRFDCGGLGLSDPLPPGVEPSIEGWGRDALAVMDAAGCERAVILASTAGALAALWLAATHPDRVASLVLVNGTARVGAAEDYGFGVSDLLIENDHRPSTCRWSRATCPRTSRSSPRAWRTGWASTNGGDNQRGAVPVRRPQPLSTWSPSRPTCAGPSRHLVPDADLLGSTPTRT